MIKKNWKTLLITGLVILLPLIWGLIAYPSLPEQIPIHFDLSGNVDGYSHKSIVLLTSPIILLIQWAAIIEAHFADKKEEMKPNYSRMISWILAAVSIAMWIVMYNCASGNLLTAQRLAPLIVGILFVAMGNFMPKQKRNRWAGLRLKWTMEDPDVWMKTHRFFGKLSVIGGFAILALSFMKNIPLAYAIMFVIMLVVIFVPVAYSYVLSKKGGKPNARSES
jgi:uncharacterized membrane protein